jgi:hypothetical protein
MLMLFSERVETSPFSDPEAYVTGVALVLEDGAWVFHDVQDFPRSTFESWPSERP